MQKCVNLMRVMVTVAMAVAAISCVAPDQARTPEDKGIRRTDYQHSLAGVYTAPLPGSAAPLGELLLAIYPDGTCLFADKRFDRAAAAVMTGRWDMSSHTQQVTLRLKSAGGARRVLVLSLQEADLVLPEKAFAPDELRLIRRDATP